jgi:hypothetical protein
MRSRELEYPTGMVEITPIETLRLIDSLRAGKDASYFAGVKAEFEAEGSRLEDLKVLLYSGKQAGLETLVKIGGCEALRDMRDLATLGRVENVLAPMIESSFALKKYLAMGKKVGEEYGFSPRLFINLETISAWRVFSDILELGLEDGSLHGVTFGRGDFAESMGFSRSEVDRSEVTEILLEACELVSAAGIEFHVGGSITGNSMGILRELQARNAHGFETRKISWRFSNLPNSKSELEHSINQGLRFELDWLEAKRSRYSRIASEDDSRVLELKKRFSVTD